MFSLQVAACKELGHKNLKADLKNKYFASQVLYAGTGTEIASSSNLEIDLYHQWLKPGVTVWSNVPVVISWLSSYGFALKHFSNSRDGLEMMFERVIGL